jgi:type IV secretory pathway VirB3-like protein
MSNTKQKGVSLLFVVLIMGVILSIGLGISSILVQQIGLLEDIGYSVVSFYAADSGVERQLYELYKAPTPQCQNTDSWGATSYTATAKCGASVLSEECPSGFEIDSDCDALNYCIKSTGKYQEVKRAIEITY